MPYAATFSILARDPAGGLIGAAIVSRLPCVGSFCMDMRPGIGAALTQAWTNPALPGLMLDRLAAGEPARAALEATMAEEVDAPMRQVALIDRAGSAAAFTGGAVEPWAGHEIGEGWSAQGNMLIGSAPLAAMAGSIRPGDGDALALRLIRALEAGHAAGGDVRGNRSAALRVMGDEVFPLVDLRVDDHDHPIEELWRLYGVAERELFPFIAALPTRADPRGRFGEVRARIAPTPEQRARIRG
jgi:uncharacterized Ntn-hydrolase superfamily protein